MQRSLVCAAEVGGCGAARHDFQPLSQHTTAAVCNEQEFGPKRTGLQLHDLMARISVMRILKGMDRLSLRSRRERQTASA